MLNQYKVTEEHIIRSIVSGRYVVGKDRIIEGVDQGNGYIRFKELGMDMYILISKVSKYKNNA